MPEFTGFSGEMIFGLVSMIMALLLWVRVLSGKRDGDEWLNRKLLERQQDIERNQSGSTQSAAPVEEHDTPHDLPKGPWG